MSVFYGRTWLSICVVACTVAVAATTWAADESQTLTPAKAAKSAKTAKPAKAEKDAATPAPPIAATIDGEPIYVAEVEVLLESLLKGRSKPKDLNRLAADSLDQVVNRRLALIAVTKDGSYATEAEIDKAVAKLKPQVIPQNLSMEEYAAQRGVSTDIFRKEVAWQLVWDRYVERNLSAGLEAYFNEHHEEFDGTQVRASHILLRSDRAGESVEQLVERAKNVRADIEAGKITFEQAAEKYSAGPSRSQAGDLGSFPRHGVMVEAFARAAFALKKGEISEPVVTPFGVHLIRVTETLPGKKRWTEVVNQIKARASADLFKKLANKERDNVKIEFTGKIPYFKPGTTEVVLPAATQ